MPGHPDPLQELRWAWRRTSAALRLIKQAQGQVSEDVRTGRLILAAENTEKALAHIKRTAELLKQAKMT